MSPESAELTKYVANALLATKISFINQMANLCEHFDADINDVRRGIGHDSGSDSRFSFRASDTVAVAFPKMSVRWSIRSATSASSPSILDAVEWVNEQQKRVLQGKIEEHFDGDLTGKTIAVWGLAFKPKTDDIREAPALVLIDRLLEMGANVHVHDPEAMDNVRRSYSGDVQFVERELDALDGADGLAIVTEWSEFRNPDFDEMKRRLNDPVVFDGRNLFEPSQMEKRGFTYYSIGRPPVGNFVAHAST